MRNLLFIKKNDDFISKDIFKINIGFLSQFNGSRVIFENSERNIDHHLIDKKIQKYTVKSCWIANCF